MNVDIAIEEIKLSALHHLHHAIEGVFDDFRRHGSRNLLLVDLSFLMGADQVLQALFTASDQYIM
jgi:hypothetical protein